MSNINTDNSLRDRYFANEIFRIGDLVEDVHTGEQNKILDRGANYVTVATTDDVVKKWLYEIKEIITPVVEVVVESVSVADKDFEILESGQIKLFGHETKNFDADLSALIIEQFSEFDDLYSKHQIVKCLDYALQESDTDRAYDLLQKVERLYAKKDMDVPFIVEVAKNDTERTRIAAILATVADIEVSPSNSKTVTDSIKALKVKYQNRKQWEVLWPFLKLAQSAGLTGALQNLPYNFGSSNPTNEDTTDDIILEAIEDNLDLMVEELSFDDINDTFLEEEFVDEELSVEMRNLMSRKLKQHSAVLSIKRERAMTKSASTAVLMQRARRLAETMLKRKLFHKSPDDMSRQEKERFESGASKRKVTVARLAQRLVGQVRALQSTRLHHTTTPASHTHDKATASIGAAAGSNGGAS